MSKPSDAIDTTLCLDDIRQKLDKIQDTELALKILENLEKLDAALAEKTAIIAEKTTRESSLININNQLFAKVSSYNDREKPADKVDYTNIDRQLNDIINKI